MIQLIIDAWLAACAQTIFLLDCLSPQQWEAQSTEAKPIRAQFAHLHNVRLMWLKMADKSLLGELKQADRRKASKVALRAALLESGTAIASLLKSAGSGESKIKGFSRTAVAFLSGAVAHEGYHRGQIELILRQSAMELAESQIMHLWDDGKMVKLARELYPMMSPVHSETALTAPT